MSGKIKYIVLKNSIIENKERNKFNYRKFLFYCYYLFIILTLVLTASPINDFQELYDYSEFYNDRLPMDLYNVNIPSKGSTRDLDKVQIVN